MKKDIVAQELEQVRKESGGTLKAEAVIEHAKDPESSLHSKFTWEDSEAAHQWRLHEARMLIRVHVKLLPQDEEKAMRVYVSMEADRYNRQGGGYRSMEEVLSDKKSRQQLLDQATAEYDRWQAKYEHLTELSEVFAAMEKVKKNSGKKSQLAAV